jgi:MFS family permease
VTSFWSLLRSNRNYRYTWLGQIVSEVGDHFNTVAVLSLALHVTGKGAAVGGVMISRLIGGIIAAPIAGIVLDRMDRRNVMVASDLMRAVLAALFITTLVYRQQWILYTLSALLFFASPFFNSGRSAILPRITSPEELHTANALTQTTAWLTLSAGAMIGGFSTAQFGYSAAFIVNAVSFLFSAVCMSRLRSPTGDFCAEGREVEAHIAARGHFLSDLTDSYRYMRHTPLMVGIAIGLIGWASGGGAAQILFTLFGEVVFDRGPAGMGILWGFAGVGLVLGGLVGHYLGRRLTYGGYLHAVWIGYFIHGAAYILFSVGNFLNAIVFITLSRMAMGANNVQNRTMLLRYVPDELRGRVFTAMDAILNTTMLLSLTVASYATSYFGPRSIALVAGIFSTLSALPWAWMTFTGRLPAPDTQLHPAPER